MTDAGPAPGGFRTLSRLGLAIAVAGALIQLVLAVILLCSAAANRTRFTRVLNREPAVTA